MYDAKITTTTGPLWRIYRFLDGTRTKEKQRKKERSHGFKKLETPPPFVTAQEIKKPKCASTDLLVTASFSRPFTVLLDSVL
jgi:hypothetical protein